MDEALVFHNPRKGSCPIYVQDDVSVGLIKPTKDLIENFGGLVTEDPQKAIVIIIVDRNTRLGSKLITNYAGESSAKGVVDQVWTLESIRQGRMLGPPDWGGYALHRHTAQTYFDDTDENTSTVAHTASSAMTGARRNLIQSNGHTPFPSSGSSGNLPASGSSVRPSPLPISQRPSLSQQTPSKQSKKSAPQNASPQPLRSPNASQPQIASSHVRDIRTEIGSRRENEAHRYAENDNSTPQPPAEEESHPLGKSGRFIFTAAEAAYIRARTERAQANAPLFLSVLARDISEAIPWHSPASITSYIQRKQLHKEILIGKTFPARGSVSGSNRLSQGRRPLNDNIDVSSQERSRPAVSPTGNEENQSSAEEIIDASDAESENRSTSEPPPEAPPRHNMRAKDGRYAYTDADKAFVVKYLAWAERANMGPSSFVYARMTELMPWHSAGSIHSFVTRTASLLGKRNVTSKSSQRRLGRASLEYRQQQTANIPSAPSTGPRQPEDAGPQISTGSNTVKDSTPGRITKQPRIASSAKGKAPSALSEAVIEAMVLVLKDNPESHWAQNNSQKRTLLWSEFAKLHPNHSAESYYQYHIQHHKQLESAARELMGDESSTDGRSERRSTGRRTTSSVIDSLVEEGKLEDPVGPLISRPGSLFDRKDCLAVIQYLADNPSLFHGPVEVPPGAVSPRVALWEKFTAKHKTRNRESWTEFHRFHHVSLENAARKLISIRLARERREGRGPSSSSMVHTTANHQPSTPISTEQPKRLGFLSRFQNLLKRSIRDDTESGSPSKKIKLEEYLP